MVQLELFHLSRCSSAPGGAISDDMTRTNFCVFTAQEDVKTMKAYAQVYKVSLVGLLGMGSRCKMVSNKWRTFSN